MTNLSPRQRYGYLPAILFHVLEVVGEDVMLRLVASCGGIRLYVGSAPSHGDRLVEAVGMPAARAIQSRMAAEHIKHFDVPRMAARLVRDRHARILTLVENGVKVADIALALGMTERAVYLVKAAARDAQPDDRQYALL